MICHHSPWAALLSTSATSATPCSAVRIASASQTLPTPVRPGVGPSQSAEVSHGYGNQMTDNRKNLEIQGSPS